MNEQQHFSQFILFVCFFVCLFVFGNFQNHTLELASLSPCIESLNEASIKLPLTDFTLKKMQNLARQWSQKTAAALERCRYEMQTKKSLLPVFFSVRKIKIELKHEKFCNLYSAFSGAFTIWFLCFQFSIFSGCLYSKSLERRVWMFVGEKSSKVPSKTLLC